MISRLLRPVTARPRRALALLLAVLVAGWLAWYTGIVPGGRMTPEEQLRARPTFEQARREYEAMLDDMRRALSGVVPTLQWKTYSSQADGRSFCSPPFTDIEGAIHANFDSGSAHGGIPEQAWPDAVRAVDVIARRHGFTDHADIPTNPGINGQPRTHYTVWKGPHGATVELGSKLGTVLTVYGGCYLYAANHPDAPPSQTATQPGR